MRATTLLNNVLDLDGVTVTDVACGVEQVDVAVRLRRRRLRCPEPDCGFSTRWRADTRPADSSWRSLDMGAWKGDRDRPAATAGLPRPRGAGRAGALRKASGAVHPRLRRPGRLVRVEKTDKTAVCRLLRIAWPTVGAIIERVVADGLDPHGLDGLVSIGVDEISWKKRHNYLTVVVDHAAGDVIWTGPGKDAAALDAFFAELGPQRAAELTAVSMDMGKAYPKSARKKGHAPQAQICWDPFHVVAVGAKAMDTVRRAHWNQLWATTDPHTAHRFKGARWALLKNPEDLSDRQTDALAAIKRTGSATWRAYRGKEALRAIFAGDLDPEEVTALLDRWCAWAQRSRLDAFIKLGRTIREHRHGILAAIRLGLSNGKVEGRNAGIRLIARRAWGFHSAEAAAAMVMLTHGPIILQLPHEQ